MNSQSIVFIDPTVSNYQTLVQSISTEAEIIVLDPNSDGTQQITDILLNRAEGSIDAVHIVSHGQSGTLYLGNSTLDTATLADPQTATSVGQWAKAFTSGADILLYGCDVAAGIAGEAFVQQLSQLTGADIAASDNKTGSAVLGGDWVLEATAGNIEAPLAFQIEVMQAYTTLLATYTVTTLNDEDDGGLGLGTGDSLREVINAANATAGDDQINFTGLTGTISLSSALPAITDNLAIIGPGADSLTISGNNESRVFFVNNGTVSFSNLTIAGGSAKGGNGGASGGGGGAGLGGGVFINGGNVTLDGVTFYGNQAQGGTGGFGGSANGGGGGGIGGDGGSDTLVGGTGGNGSPLAGKGGTGGSGNDIINANGSEGGEGSGGGGGGAGGFNNGGNGGIGGFGGGGGGGGRGGGGGEFGQGSGGNGGIGGFGGGGGGGNGGIGGGSGGAGGQFGGTGAGATNTIGGGGGGGAGLGGAIFVRSGASLTLTNTEFSGNSALGGAAAANSTGGMGTNGQGKGGGIFADTGATVNATGPVTFIQNTASNAGGTATDSNDLYGSLIPTVSISATGTPSESGTPGTLTLSRTTTTGNLRVYFSIAGSATLNTDYSVTGVDTLMGSDGFVTIADGSSSVDITITPVDDSEMDAGETVQLALVSSGGYTVTSPDSASLTIDDNELDYAIAASALTVAEGNAGVQTVTFSITRTGRTDIVSSVDYAISGTAVSGTDYNNIAGTSGATATTGSINFAAGETSKTITLDVLGDTVAENNKDIVVTLSNPAAAGFTPTLSTAVTTTTIIDNETPGITMTPSSGLETTEAGGTATFTVVLNTQPTAEVAISLSSSNSAEGTVSSSSLTFTPNNWNQPQTVTVTGIDDTALDGDGAYTIITAAATSTDPNYSGIDAADISVTNKDNDAPLPDSAGNTPIEASAIAVASASKTYEDSVSNGDLDYYEFSLGASNDLNLSLEGLSADANVELLDSNQKVIARSTNAGLTSELINETLEHGTYLVRVASTGDVGTPYKLNLSVTPRLQGVTTTASDAPAYIVGEIVPPANGYIIPATDVSGPLINMDDFRAAPRFAGIDGSGFSTVILDTGIDLDDPFFGSDSDANGVADRIVYDYDFADSDADASDVNGHGSNVSSIAASEDATHTGMAPAADIIHLKVFRNSGSGNFSYIEQALQWVVANAETYNIASVNMSLSDSGNHNTPQSLYGISDELAQLAAMNVIVVSASGNSFYPFGSEQGVAYPSADPNSLSVGAVYDANSGGFSYDSGAVAYSSGADRITPFSQRHNTLTTIFAPGAPITGAGPNAGLVTMHGTSQAAPHIAGIAALAQQLAMAELGHRLTPAEFANLLNSSGVPINDGDDEDDNVTNTGLDFRRVDMLGLGQAIVGNQAPVVNNPAFAQSAAGGFSQTGNSFTLAADTFTDSDAGDSITYSMSVANTIDESWFTWETALNGQFYRQPIAGVTIPEVSLPSWLSFDSATRTINLNPATRPATFDFTLKITGTDTAGASAHELIRFKSYALGGFIIDSYIAGATVFLDANKNGILDNNEPSTTSDAGGKYELNSAFDAFDLNQNGEIDAAEGNIVAFGGTDTATGLPLETPVKAPADASVVTLLTSLVAELIEEKIDSEEANAKVVAAFSLPADVDLSALDPIAATSQAQSGGVETLTVMTKAQNFITQTAGLIDGASSLDMKVSTELVVSAIAEEILKGAALDLSNADQLTAMIEIAVSKAKQLDINFNSVVDSQFITNAAKVMAASNQYVDGVVASTAIQSLLIEIAGVQKVTLDEVVKDLKAAAAGTKPISEVVSENTGTPLDVQIKGTPLDPDTDAEPDGGTDGGTDTPRVPVVTGTIEFINSSEDQTFGTEGDDTLIGTSGDDAITGKQGNDSILGSEGNDLLFGNQDNDFIDGNLGNDTLYGGKDNDTLLGGGGLDKLCGNLGDDSLNGGDGDNYLNGNQGKDSLDGGVGNDIIHGGKDNDILTGNSGADALCGDAGDDSLDGGNDNDYLNGNSGSDILDGGAGNDTLHGGKDNDSLAGNVGADLLMGDMGDDSLDGGADNDLLCGNQGNDAINGSDGDDSLYGGKDNDTLIGGASNDLVSGDMGDDLLTGSTGSDWFVLRGDAGTDVITDFTDGEDLMALSGGLTFAQLTITSGNNAAFIYADDQLIAIVNSVDINNLSASDFSLIG